MNRQNDEVLIAQKLEVLIASIGEIQKLSPDALSTQLGGIGETIHELKKELAHAVSFAAVGSFEIQKRCLELLRLLKPGRVKGFQKKRFGAPNDGGYVMVDDFVGVAAALSFGIANDASWDEDVADRGIPVYQFDHSIEAPPVIRPDLIWEKSCIAAQPAKGARTIDELVNKYGSATAATLVLKIDIEGHEWAAFDSVSDNALASFTQIVGEFHFFKNIVVSAEWHQQAVRVFKKLNRHFSIVHIHANNGQGVDTSANVWMPHLLEITYVNRSRYSVGDTDEIFPGPLDAPNRADLPDIHLGPFIY